MRPLLLAATLLTALLAPSATAAAGPAPAPLLRDAWIALPPPGTSVVAAYLVLENRGAAPLRIVGARAAGFRRAEMHESYLEGDRMKMRARPTLDVAVGARLELAPGGLHLMLFDPAQPPSVGAVHEVTLLLADGRSLTVRAAVRDPRLAPR
jgi:copper(I)-binding protein